MSFAINNEIEIKWKLTEAFANSSNCETCNNLWNNIVNIEPQKSNDIFDCMFDNICTFITRCSIECAILYFDYYELKTGVSCIRTQITL